MALNSANGQLPFKYLSSISSGIYSMSAVMIIVTTYIVIVTIHIPSYFDLLYYYLWLFILTYSYTHIFS